jgi:hypothetical protein
VAITHFIYIYAPHGGSALCIARYRITPVLVLRVVRCLKGGVTDEKKDFG